MIEMHIINDDSVYSMSDKLDELAPKLMEVTAERDGICMRFYPQKDSDEYIAEVLIPKEADKALKRLALWKATVVLFYA